MTTRQKVDLYPQLVKTAYEKWAEGEGVSLLDTPAGTDLLTITELYPWDRIGARAVILNQPVTMRGQVGAFLLEIPPKASTKPQHHLYDENLYILQGHGHTQVWVTEDKKVSVEWQTHDLMAIPLNAWFQITNLGDQPAKILSINTAPCVINCFNNTDFVFHNDYIFSDRFSGQEDYYKTSKEWYTERGWVHEANFVKDIYNRPLPELPTRPGVKGFYWMSNSPLAAYCTEHPKGTYNTAHRHIIPGWFSITIRGKGYVLAWKGDAHHWSKASEKMRYERHEVSVSGYPDPWYHQYFNIGNAPFRSMGTLYGFGPTRPVWVGAGIKRSIAEGGDQVMFDEEDPEILRLFMEELKKEGLEVRPLHEWRYG